LIRTEADEVTYNLHILLRYRLEKPMVAGEIKVADLPALWNEEMERLLGIRPKNDSEGVLQDIHWSHGSIGYFPTYTLGNVIAAQLRHAFGPLDEAVAAGRFSEIKEWLRDRIHRWGAVYPPKELVARATGEVYNPSYLLNYLENKYK